LASVEALLGALQQFAGTLVFISHDVYFIRELANGVVHVQDGRLTHFPGGYQYYLDKTSAQRAAAAATDASAGDRPPNANETRPARERSEQKRLAAERRQARSRELRAAREVVDRFEEQIAALETRQADLTAALENPQTYEQTRRTLELTRETREVVSELDRLTAEWEAAATRLAELEQTSSAY